MAVSTRSFAEAIAGFSGRAEDVEAVAANGFGRWLRMGLTVREKKSICWCKAGASFYTTSLR